MKVHVLVLHGSETIKDCDSDYLHPTTTMVVGVFANEVYAKQAWQKYKAAYEELNKRLAEAEPDEDSDVECFLDAFVAAQKDLDKEICEDITNLTSNNWAEEPSEMLNKLEHEILPFAVTE